MCVCAQLLVAVCVVSSLCLLFRQWGEGTQIEPAVAYRTISGEQLQDYGAAGPDRYMELTREFATRFKQSGSWRHGAPLELPSQEKEEASKQRIEMRQQAQQPNAMPAPTPPAHILPPPIAAHEQPQLQQAVPELRAELPTNHVHAAEPQTQAQEELEPPSQAHAQAQPVHLHAEL